MELDLPTGNDTSGGNDHAVKFLLTLKELVDVLGRTGPGGPSGGGAPTGGTADQNSGKNLVKATQKLFTDLANAFKPLKTVLATFGAIHPQKAAAPAAPSDNRLDDAKYDRFFSGPPTPPKPETPPEQAPVAAITPPPEPEPTPKAPKAKAEQKEQAPVAAITVQDASIGIDYASVKMPAAPAPKAKPKPEPEPEKQPEPLLAKLVDIDTNLVKITVPTASFKITSALLQGKFFMPPEAAAAKPAPEAKPETAPKEKADKTPAEKPAPEKTPKEAAPEKPAKEKPKKAQGESAAALLTWGNVFKRLIGGADERKNKTATKGKDKPEKETEEKADDTQDKNASAKEAAQNLQNAIINIANGVVNVTTGGEKKENEQEQEQEQDNNSEAAKDFAQSQADQVKGNKVKPKPAGGGRPKTAPAGGGPKPMPAGGGPKPMPAGGGGPKGPKMGDPRAMIILAVAKIATSLNQAAISLAHKAVDVIQKAQDAAGKAIGGGVAAPFKEVGKKIMGGSDMLMKAFSDPMGAFKDLTSSMIGFVSVVNPATVMQFTKAMTDVTAIAGKALAPALAIATQVVREFGDIMAPIYETLTPFITMIARAFGDMFIAMVRVSAIFMQVLLPISKSLYIALAGLARIVTALLEGITVLLAGFLGTFDGFDGMIQKAVDAIVDFSKWLTRAAVSVAVLIAKLFGATQFIANMQKVAGNKGATNRTDSTGQAAPTMGNFTSLESFGKNIAQASFTATSVAAAPKKTDDFLATISDDINGLAQLDLKQIIVDAILQAGKSAVKDTVKTVGQTAYDYNPLKRPGEAIGNFIGGMLFG
ncbi:hypothetical protein UFOVP822_50 [uncultured Caudovirales phage]|uniref:Uncharacterized protein n=1 Tax=uncultured Caudovirales phage TaxID=2100421 RepID=A0A6J5P8M5_9CAUD|nr:hypothetical protein UFOVP822_50 [uncultured Caudovirales phage]